MQDSITPSSPWFDLVPDTRRFPPLSGAVTSDVIVLGGGMVGVMAAYCLATSGRDVALVERNHVGTGDTGFTTAFLTRVPDASAADLVKRYGRGFLRDLFAATADAQQFVVSLIRERRIDCDLVACNSFNGSYEIGNGGLADEWQALEGADPGIRFLSRSDAPPAARPFVESIVIEHEARFHVRKFLVGLIEAAGPRLRVFEESDVQSVDAGARVRAATSTGSIEGRVLITACGAPPELFDELARLVSPKLTFAVAARFAAGAPVADHLFWDCDEPYQYFRRLDERTVIVGGADRDESAAHAGGDPHEQLRAFVGQRLGPAFDLTHRWSGSLFETTDGLPYIAPHPHHRDRVFFTTGLSGNGMVMGALAGRLLAGFATGSADSRLVPLFGLDRTGMKIAQTARSGAQTSSGTPARPAPTGFQAVAQLSEVAPGSARCVTVGKTPLAIVNVEGRVFALDNRCTHAGGKMCEGDLDRTVIECPLHGSRFEVSTGAVVAGPARLPLATHDTRVVDGRIEVRV
jgi:glycine/D-amino acid oxidase-like deaminating enzyme/nitrite reductase/ring-hydroxylating ferredoxin subunit